MKMENVKCAICGVDDTIILFTKGDLTTDIINVVCKRCGLVYMNPRPTSNEYRQFHIEDFLRERHGLVEAEQLVPKIKGSDLKMKSEVASFMGSILKPGSRVLDVGCGFGTLLNILKTKYGAVVQGIELATVDVEAAKTFYSLELFNGSLKDFFLKYSDQKFDLIALHHTFEHMSEPRAELATMREMLAPGGVLYIGVPNVMNLKKRPEIFFQMGHAYSYSPHTLEKILSLEGFKIIKFNRRAAFPGAMELLAMRAEDLYGHTLVEGLKEGSDTKYVYYYIHWTRIKFALLRTIRDLALFWLPDKLRLKISHFILQILKKI